MYEATCTTEGCSNERPLDVESQSYLSKCDACFGVASRAQMRCLCAVHTAHLMTLAKINRQDGWPDLAEFVCNHGVRVQTMVGAR